MFTATVTHSEGHTEIRLAGVLDFPAADDFARALERLEPTVRLDLQDVKRITSYGVGLLIRHLSAISKHHTVEFARCSETMVDQFQMLKFSSYGRITSFHARYACSRCQRTDSMLLEVARLQIDKREKAVRAPVFPCRCGGQLDVDDSLEFVVDHV